MPSRLAVVDQIRGIAANPSVVDEVVRQLAEQQSTQREVLEREKRVMERELSRLAGEIPSLVRALREFDVLWEEMKPREQEKFVKTLVEKVTYDGRTGKVTVGFRTAGIPQLCIEMRSK